MTEKCLHTHVFVRHGSGDGMGDWRCECGEQTRFMGKCGIYTTPDHLDEAKRYVAKTASLSRG